MCAPVRNSFALSYPDSYPVHTAVYEQRCLLAELTEMKSVAFRSFRMQIFYVVARISILYLTRKNR
ncbi:MAG: hypothetical protein H6618_09770 [Deltaproteobacteria bacterium]|nr:hypothetical protein [Deltaproteobacteria bacterium]